nr:hypothetical protein [Streptomyces sp. V3I8]
MDGPAAEAEAERFGERRHDHGRSDVPDGAGREDGAVAVGGGQAVFGGRAGVRVLLADVAPDHDAMTLLDMTAPATTPGREAERR